MPASRSSLIVSSIPPLNLSMSLTGTSVIAAAAATRNATGLQLETTARRALKPRVLVSHQGRTSRMASCNHPLQPGLSSRGREALSNLRTATFALVLQRDLQRQPHHPSLLQMTASLQLPRQQTRQALNHLPIRSLRDQSAPHGSRLAILRTHSQIRTHLNQGMSQLAKITRASKQNTLHLPLLARV